MGLALQSLRAEGVMIIGSGSSFHNFDYFFAKGPKKQEGIQHATAFDTWMRNLLNPSSSLQPKDRLGQLKNWASAPSAFKCHPNG